MDSDPVSLRICMSDKLPSGRTTGVLPRTRMGKRKYDGWDDE